MLLSVFLCPTPTTQNLYIGFIIYKLKKIVSLTLTNLRKDN